MVLEATMICVDNSDFMRNGDYPPSRLDQLSDAVNILSNAKTGQNPENTVGLLTMAGDLVKLRASLTADVGKILSSMHEIEVGGITDIETGVQVAALGLRHRQNKNQRQRVVVFVASPYTGSPQDLVKLGKKLKKSKIAVDVISFGQDENIPILQGFIDAVNSGDNSHFVHVPTDGPMVSDVIRNTPIMAGDEVMVGMEEEGAAAAGGGMQIGGDMDPDMAMAIQMSIAEEEERQRRAVAEAETQQPQAEQPTPAAATTGTTTEDLAATLAAGVDGVAGDEAALLAQAIAMSMGQEEEEEDDEAMDTREEGVAGDYMDLDDDAAMELAIQMSMAEEKGEEKATEDQLMEDPQFMQGVLSRLPGVDADDESILTAAGLRRRKVDKDDDVEEDDKKEKKDE